MRQIVIEIVERGGGYYAQLSFDDVEWSTVGPFDNEQDAIQEGRSVARDYLRRPVTPPAFMDGGVYV